MIGVAKLFSLRLFELCRQGRFPADMLMTTYDFGQVDEAADDAESGATIKHVPRMG